MTNEDAEPMPPAPLNGARATAADEDAVLRNLYGPPDSHGVFRAVGT